jgi:hypothetical protein
MVAFRFNIVAYKKLNQNSFYFFQASELKLSDQLAKADRRADDVDAKLAQELQTCNLRFLMPILALKQEMVGQLGREASPTAFAKWLGENVPAKYHIDSEFIMALINVVISHIVETTTSEAASVESAVDENKKVFEAEKELLSKYRYVNIILIEKKKLQTKKNYKH